MTTHTYRSQREGEAGAQGQPLEVGLSLLLGYMLKDISLPFDGDCAVRSSVDMPPSLSARAGARRPLPNEKRKRREATCL